MKLKNKLILSCLAVTTLVIGVGTMGFYTAHIINDNFDTVTEQTAPSLIALGQARSAMFRMIGEAVSTAMLEVEKQHHAASDLHDVPDLDEEIEDDQEEEQEDFAEAFIELKEALTDYQSLVTTPLKQALARVLHEYSQVLWEESQKMMPSETHSHDESLLKEKEALEQIEKAFLGIIDDAIVHEFADLQIENQVAHHSADNALRVNLVAILLFVLLVSVIGILVTYTIASPILTLNAAALQVAQGQLDTRVKVTSNDEVGTLANSFNYMVEQLRNTVEQLHDLYAHLKLAHDQANAANRAKSQFLAHISHELRTPLNGILGYTQILTRDKTLTEKQLQGIQVIQRSGEYLLTLINDILDLSKIEAGKIDLSPTTFEFDQFIQGVLDLFGKRVQQKGITLTYHPLTPLPKALSADEKRLRQILLNLLGNAIKFTEQGGVTLKIGRVEEFETPLETVNTTSLFRFQIEDTGVGIAPENLQKIFLPFEQVGAHSYKYEGTGLGLPITKKLIELMGGELHVESILGRGSTFGVVLTLPEVSSPVEASPFLSEPTSIIGFQGTPRKILVVDDYWENRSVLIQLLTPLGFEIREACHGQEGLTQAQDWLPDVIITNLTMPVMDGLSMIQALRHLDNFKQIPILVASASVFEADQQRCFEAGSTAFLPKPILAVDLFKVLQEQLELTWIYESSSESSQPPVIETAFQADSDVWVTPSPAQLETLLELTKMGDFGGILEYLEELGQDHQQLLPFLKQVRQLAKSFDEQQIVHILESYLQPK